MSKLYKIGTPEQQEYLRAYNFAPKGYAFLEPGIIGSDAKEFVAFNIAKSFYQVYPEVFNLSYVEKATGIKPAEAKKRLKRLYDEKMIMLVKNSCVGIMGFGLYYWVVKLTPNATPEERKEITDFFQNNDQICTGYPMLPGGDFDFFNGNHMRNLDNLIYGVLDKFRSKPYVEYVHLCPVRRLIRESSVNQFDAKEGFRHYFFGADEAKKAASLKRGMDEKDFAIIEALNNSPTVAELFDYHVLSELSGLKADEMREDLVKAVDHDKGVIPMIYLNYRALGLHQRFYLVSLFENTPTWRSEEIADELAKDGRFVNFFDFADAHHNYMLSVYDELVDASEIRERLLSYGEVKEVKEALSERQFRRWTARLDSENGLYEECIFTDDVLLDRSQEDR